MSISISERRTRPCSPRSYRPMPIRWVRSVGYPWGASWTTTTEEYVPSGATDSSGRNVLTCAVSSHCAANLRSSRPDADSSAESRPARKASRPTYATSCLITLAPLAYVIPSKFTSTASTSGISLYTGWVDESWSCRYPQVLRTDRKVVQASVNRVAFELHQWLAHSANDSLSHRSSHHRMVTRSPNHMCAISCRIVLARCSCSKSVTGERHR